MSEPINITNGIPSEVYVAIGRGRYDSQYEACEACAESMQEEIAKLMADLAQAREEDGNLRKRLADSFQRELDLTARCEAAEEQLRQTNEYTRQVEAGAAAMRDAIDFLIDHGGYGCTTEEETRELARRLTEIQSGYAGTALLARVRKLEAVAQRILRSEWPEDCRYIGEHETDARHTYPNRMKWIEQQLRTALASTPAERKEE